ncbi:hypothetical protein JG687_00013539 [Phytophthora cactorum]|uniref:DDE Tnp4 domain-containing protein n=1 Tax=Phytophthora cactorum TaxID=29920 RepID=A0A8T1U1M2_9STRA|nr:hypothetical protein JG687_00013539 [Phytophthora cactorum]
MPRPSACQVALRELRVVLDLRAEAAALRHFYDDEDLSEDGLDVLHAASYGRVLGSRYFDRPSSYRRRSDCWKNLLYETTLLNKDEFLEHFRLERVAFFRLVDLVRYHWALVSAKKPAGGVMDPTHAYFNSQLATARIKSELCIGLRKTRFQYLNGIRLKLAKRRHLRRIIRYVTFACILHNSLITEPSVGKPRVGIEYERMSTGAIIRYWMEHVETRAPVKVGCT